MGCGLPLLATHLSVTGAAPGTRDVDERSVGIPASCPSCREVGWDLGNWCKSWNQDTRALHPALWLDPLLEGLL